MREKMESIQEQSRGEERRGEESRTEERRAEQSRAEQRRAEESREQRIRETAVHCHHCTQPFKRSVYANTSSREQNIGSEEVRDGFPKDSLGNTERCFLETSC